MLYIYILFAVHRLIVKIVVRWIDKLHFYSKIYYIILYYYC